MTEVRRLDEIERVVRDTRRNLDDLTATALSRLGTHTHPGVGGGGGVTDHGALSGLGDDDHPRYQDRGERVDVNTANFYDVQTTHQQNGDAFSRHSTYGDGYLTWGPGNTDWDVALYRSAAGVIKTNGRIGADAGITLAGTDLATRLSGIDTSLDGKANVGHSHEVAALTSTGHEGRYYQAPSGGPTPAQTVPTNADTRIYFQASEYTTPDVTRVTGNASTGSTFTLNRAGLWELSCTLRLYVGGTASAERYLCISEGATTGNNRYAATGVQPGGPGPVTLTCTTSTRFAAGASIAAWCYQGSGASLNVETIWRSTNFSLTWLRP